MWATDSGNGKIYAYRLSDAATLYTLNLTSKIPSVNTGFAESVILLDPPFDEGGARYAASVPYASTNFTVSPTALYTNSTTVSISTADADTTIAGHQVNLAIGNNQISITVTNTLTTSLPRTRTYTVNINREFYTFNDPSKDIPLTSLASANIQGLWSDGATMWVVNSGNNKKIYAHNMWTNNAQGVRVWDGKFDDDKDFTLHAENADPKWNMVGRCDNVGNG